MREKNVLDEYAKVFLEAYLDTQARLLSLCFMHSDALLMNETKKKTVEEGSRTVSSKCYLLLLH